MSVKKSNEITVKIKCALDEFYKILEEKGFNVTCRFSMDDTYFVPETLKLENMVAREILSKAILTRDIIGHTSGKRTKLLTFKMKNFDANGDILNQEAVKCEILDINDAKKFLKAIGYKELMNIFEEDVVYEKNGLELAVKNIKNGDKLVEIETTEKVGFETIDDLKKKVHELELPIYTDNYFVKKAEIELEKILRKEGQL